MRRAVGFRRTVVVALFLAANAVGCKKPAPAESVAEAPEAGTTTESGGPDLSFFGPALQSSFAKKYSCPEDRVLAKQRPDIDPIQALGRDEDLSLGTAPDEIKNDPGRYAKWKADRESGLARRKGILANHAMWEVTGCGHTDIFGCPTYDFTKPMPAHTVSHGSGVSCDLAKPSPPTVSTLGTTSLSSEWVPIDAPPFLGADRPFDVIANLEWASAIATAWSSDATFYLLTIAGVKLDGTVDLSPRGASVVKFYFNSATKGNVDLGLQISPSRGDSGTANVLIEATQLKDKADRRMVTKPTCALARAVDAVRSAGALAKADPAFGLDVELWAAASKSYWRVAYHETTTQGFVKNSVGFHRAVNATTCAMEHTK